MRHRVDYVLKQHRERAHSVFGFRFVMRVGVLVHSVIDPSVRLSICHHSTVSARREIIEST